MIRISLLTILVFSLIFLSTTPDVYANDSMQKDHSFLELQQLNSSDSQVNPTPTEKQKLVDNVKISFTRSDQGTKGFYLSVSPLLIDYGILSPTNPILRTSTITISNLASPAYSVFAQEDHPLIMTKGNFIPNTSCDNGACTSLRSAGWMNTLTFGFGYRCDNNSGDACNALFLQKNDFAQFPDSTQNERMIDVMRSVNTRKTDQVTITYKINTAGSQAPGSYSNTISYIAVPGF